MPIDKDALYHTWNQSVDRQQKIHEQAIRKSLDLPLEDDVNITTTHNGVSGKAMAGILAGMVAAGGGGMVVMNQVQQQATPPPQAIVQPGSMDFTVLHRNSDGDIIDVPQWKPGAQE